MKVFVTLIILVFSRLSLADLSPAVIEATNQDEVIIEAQWTENLNFEDPEFSRPLPQRGIANLRDGFDATASTDWQGDLEVLKEIPYSYPEVTRQYLETRILNRLEERDSKRQ